MNTISKIKAIILGAAILRISSFSSTSNCRWAYNSSKRCIHQRNRRSSGHSA